MSGEWKLQCSSIKVKNDGKEELVDGWGNKISIRFCNLVLLSTNCDVRSSMTCGGDTTMFEHQG